MSAISRNGSLASGLMKLIRVNRSNVAIKQARRYCEPNPRLCISLGLSQPPSGVSSKLPESSQAALKARLRFLICAFFSINQTDQYKSSERPSVAGVCVDRSQEIQMAGERLGCAVSVTLNGYRIVVFRSLIPWYRQNMLLKWRLQKQTASPS